MAESLVGVAGLARAARRFWCPQSLASLNGVSGYPASRAQGGSPAMGDQVEACS